MKALLWDGSVCDLRSPAFPFGPQRETMSFRIDGGAGSGVDFEDGGGNGNGVGGGGD